MYLYENKMWNDDVSEVIKLNQWIKEYEGKRYRNTCCSMG